MTNQEFFEKYPEIIVYDFEVFPRYWCMCYLSAESPEFPQFVEAQGKNKDDMLELKKVWEPNKEKVWVGYNSNHYDRYIFAAILNSTVMKAIHSISKRLISGASVKQYQAVIPEMRSYDTGDKFHSLKQLEGFMGHSIEESNVSFDKPDDLTPDEKSSVIKYCSHDVLETLEVLKRKISDYEAHRNIIKTFGLPPEKICLSKAQLTAEVLGCEYVSDEELESYAAEEWEKEIKEDCIVLNKYATVKEWYETPANYKEKQKLQIDVMGVPHVFGLGGAHGAIKKYHQAGGNMWHIDVTSYYPSIMIQHDLLTRRAKDKNKFQEIYDTRVALKAAGKKAEQAPYKIILNSTFGITNYRYSKAYDPKMNHAVCINGQLMILMLLEMLEGKCRLIQSNTDGIIIDAKGFDFDEIRRTCDEWCRITKMSVGYDEIDELWQKDVNNYLFRFAGSGKYEAKGSYVKFNDDLDNDMAIINKAVRQGLIEGSIKAVDRCIDECDDIIAFQKIVKLSNKYKYAWFGETKIDNHKCFRVFAVKRGNEMIYKQRDEGATHEKFANTPERAALVFGDLSDPELKAFGGRKFDVSRIDKKYYKTLARKRFNEFGGGLS